MIQPNPSIQIFQQNIGIQKQLCQKWGYNIDNSGYQSPRQVLSHKKQGLNINQNINPLQVKQKQGQKSPRHKQLIHQMQQHQIQKIVNKMAEQEDKNGLNVPQLINTKIREYNYLIDHKHLINRKHAKSLFQILNQQKNQTRKNNILQKIRQQDKQMNKTGNLLTKYNRNKQMNNLYKEYSNSMRFVHNKTRISRQLFQRDKKIAQTDSKSFVKIRDKSPTAQQASLSMSKSRLRYDDQVDTQRPFVSEKFIKENNQISDHSKRNRHILQIMRERLSKLSMERNDSSSIMITKNQKQKQKQEYKTQLSRFSSQLMYSPSKISDTKQSITERQKKSYLSTALKKINPKFIKAQGSKFVVKLSTDLIAKQMIDGPQLQKKQPIKLHVKKMYNRNLSIPAHLNEQQKNVMKMMIEEQDDAYYWTMCRNQKLNLLLKGKKHE